MFFVYILKSQKKEDQFYIGFTENLERRLKEHNTSDESRYTKKYAPWEIETYISFKSREKALSFEKYLKVGSGYAFFKKRLI